MKKAKHAVLAIGLLAFLFVPLSAHAWTYVLGLDGTGWQTYTSQPFANGFNGTLGFVVSNAPDQDDLLSSYLLLDNLNTNPGFESGLAGYTLAGAAEVATTFSLSLQEYTPREGSNFAVLRSMDSESGDDASNFADISFLNAYGENGGYGTILELPISIAAGGVLSFDWAFVTQEPGLEPWLDFSLAYLQNGGLQVIELGQVEGNPVPVPPSVLLLAPGLLGLLYVRRFRK